MNPPPVLYIVTPCYNEDSVLPKTLPLFIKKLTELIDNQFVSQQSKILLVDDGSSDGTWNIIEEHSRLNDCICGISLSRNKGHQNAILAGMTTAEAHADIVITVDCDGQDDLNAMERMVEAYAQGCDVVYGVRNNRDSDTFFKRFTAESFYRLINAMGAEVIFNHADFRLVSKRVLLALNEYKEVNLFLRGIFPMIGFQTGKVYYKRDERVAGKSHYSLAKMLSLAFDGITSLSIRPIRLITALGGLFSLLSFCGIIWVLFSFFFGYTVPGWGSSMCCICFIGGIQMISLGIIGEYIGKIYLETKQRPRFLVDKRANI